MSVLVTGGADFIVSHLVERTVKNRPHVDLAWPPKTNDFEAKIDKILLMELRGSSIQ